MILITIIFLFFFFQPRQILAVSPVVNIIEPLPNNIVGDEISVTFTVNSLNIGTTYHYKIVGDDNADISTLPNTSCSSNYENCENLTITVDKIATATAKARLNTSTGTDNIKIRIAQSDRHSSTFDSPFVAILSILPTPSPTLTPTLIPTLTPTPNPTNTPTPTTIPTLKPTSTPIIIPTFKTTSAPTLTLAPTPTSIIIINPTEEEILGATDIIDSPTQIPKPVEKIKTSSSKNFIPFIFIGLGGLLLFTPIFLSKIKHCPKKILKQ